MGFSERILFSTLCFIQFEEVFYYRLIYTGPRFSGDIDIAFTFDDVLNGRSLENGTLLFVNEFENNTGFQDDDIKRVVVKAFYKSKEAGKIRQYLAETFAFLTLFYQSASNNKVEFELFDDKEIDLLFDDENLPGHIIATFRKIDGEFDICGFTYMHERDVWKDYRTRMWGFLPQEVEDNILQQLIYFLKTNHND